MGTASEYYYIVSDHEHSCNVVALRKDVRSDFSYYFHVSTSMFLSFKFAVMSNDSIASHLIRALVSRHRYIPSLTFGCRVLEVIHKQATVLLLIQP